MKSKSKSRTRLEHDHNELRVFYKRGDAEQEEEMIRVTSINNHSTSSSTSSKKSRKKSTWKPKHRDELPVETDKLLKRLKTMNCSIREKFGIANHSLLPVSDYVPRKKNSIKKCEIPLAPPKVPNHGAPLQSSESLKTLYSKSLHSISTKSQQTRSSSMSPSMISTDPLRPTRFHSDTRYPNPMSPDSRQRFYEMSKMFADEVMDRSTEEEEKIENRNECHPCGACSKCTYPCLEKKKIDCWITDAERDRIRQYFGELYR